MNKLIEAEVKVRVTKNLVKRIQVKLNVIVDDDGEVTEILYHDLVAVELREVLKEKEHLLKRIPTLAEFKEVLLKGAKQLPGKERVLLDQVADDIDVIAIKQKDQWSSDTTLT